MKKKIEDMNQYWPLYIGCEALIGKKGNNEGDLIGTIVGYDSKNKGTLTALYYANGVNSCIVPVTVKPILRPLSDMTEEEMRKFASIEFYEGSDYSNMCLKAKIKYVDEVGFILENTIATHDDLKYQFKKCWQIQMMWLLKQGFDLFGLIDAGLALDKTKI